MQMAETYARRIIRGDMKIMDIPAPWREAAKTIVERKMKTQRSGAR